MTEDEFKKIPQLEIGTSEVLWFTCNMCKPRITFTEMEAHALHGIEIHNTRISYKAIMMSHFGVRKSVQYGIPSMTEEQIVRFIIQMNRQGAR